MEGKKESLEPKGVMAVLEPTKKDLSFPKGMTQLKKLEGGIFEDSRGKKYYRDVNGSLRKVK